MGDVKIVLNSEGVRALLKSSEIQAECMRQAQSMQATLGDGYVAEKNYPERAGAIIRAESSKAKQDNLDNNTLLKAVGNND